jgi:hypothetical protein
MLSQANQEIGVPGGSGAELGLYSVFNVKVLFCLNPPDKPQQSIQYG